MSTRLTLRHENVCKSDRTHHVLLTSANVEGDLSASRLCRFAPWERAPSVCWTGGWLGHGARLGDMHI